MQGCWGTLTSALEVESEIEREEREQKRVKGGKREQKGAKGGKGKQKGVKGGKRE